MEGTNHISIAELSDDQLLVAYRNGNVDKAQGLEEILRRGLDVPEDDAEQATVEWEGDEYQSDPHTGSIPPV